MVRKSSVALIGACLICFASGVRAEEKHGSLVIIGGALRSTERGITDREIWERIVELAGGDGVARIAVFPTASGSPAESGRRLGQEYLRRRDRAGGSTEGALEGREEDC